MMTLYNSPLISAPPHFGSEKSELKFTKLFSFSLLAEFFNWKSNSKRVRSQEGRGNIKLKMGNRIPHFVKHIIQVLVHA